jgi:actin-related protein
MNLIETVVPVIDGKVQLHLVVTENIGGYDITTHFINQLNKRGLGFDSSVHYLIADALKVRYT